MSAKRGLGKGLDAKLFAVGMGFLALGAAGAYVGLFTRFGVRIGSIPIPLSIVGPAVALVGLVVLALSFRQEKCLDCGAALDIHLAAFDPSAERYVVASAAALDAAALDALPVGTHAGPNVQVSLQPCPKCRQIAKLEVSAFRPSREALLPPRVVTGPALARFIDVVAARAAAHEKTYDDATA